ncbi:MAG: UBP-type zinc finger domain-containing protein [Chloroflexota bacterium]
MQECTHGNDVHQVRARTDGCEECLKTGDRWLHLRLCMECGHVGCCDDSTNKHGSRHFHATKHPVMVSFEPGEDWGWCFVDEVMLDADWPIEGPRHHSRAANAHVGY